MGYLACSIPGFDFEASFSMFNIGFRLCFDFFIWQSICLYQRLSHYFYFLFFLCLVPRIVRSYLLHYGYGETLKFFDEASESAVPPISLTQENGFNEQDSAYALKERQILRQVQNFL